MPWVIVSDNRTQFANIFVVDLHRYLELETNFIFVVNPQANGQVESTNKVIDTPFVQHSKFNEMENEVKLRCVV